MTQAPTKDQILTSWNLVGFMTNPGHQQKLEREGKITNTFLNVAARAMRVVQGEHFTASQYREIAQHVISASKALLR